MSALGGQVALSPAAHAASGRPSPPNSPGALASSGPQLPAPPAAMPVAAGRQNQAPGTPSMLSRARSGVRPCGQRSGQPPLTSALTDPGHPRSSGQRPGITRPRTRYHHRGTRASNGDLPQCRGHQPTRRRLRVRVRCLPWPAASVLGDPQVGSASEATGPLPGTFLAPSVGLCGMLPWPPCPAFHRRSFWLDQASARRALAVPSRGSSDASATAPTSSRCSPEPPVRSRRPPCAAA